MIAEKVLGAYASIAAMPAAEQAEQYRKASEDRGINTFELPLMAGRPLLPELIEVFSGLSSSLVVTMVTQWAIAGQQTPAYGLSSTEEAPRREAILDVCSVLEQCLSLSRKGVRIRNIVVHAGQRCGGKIPHAIAFFQSLAEIRRAAAAVLPGCRLAVEVTDSRPLDHPVAFPASKKASLNLSVEAMPTPTPLTRSRLAKDVAKTAMSTDRNRIGPSNSSHSPTAKDPPRIASLTLFRSSGVLTIAPMVLRALVMSRLVTPRA